MIYKVKFDIKYQTTDAKIIRKLKLELLESEVNLEIVSENSIYLPSLSHMIYIGDLKYKVIDIEHILKSDSLTSIISITKEPEIIFDELYGFDDFNF